jgi:hypothetical protein
MVYVLLDEHPDSLNAGGFANMMVESPPAAKLLIILPVTITAQPVFPLPMGMRRLRNGDTLAPPLPRVTITTWR